MLPSLHPQHMNYLYAGRRRSRFRRRRRRSDKSIGLLGRADFGVYRGLGFKCFPSPRPGVPQLVWRRVLGRSAGILAARFDGFGVVVVVVARAAVGMRRNGSGDCTLSSNGLRGAIE